MPDFTFRVPEFGNTPLTVPAETREEALRKLQAASKDEIAGAVEQSLKARQNKTGMSDQDIDAILGRTGHRAGGENALDSLSIGAGRSLTQIHRGLMQIGTGLIPEEARQNLGLKSLEELDADEEEALKLYQQIDSDGWGLEDIGEALPEMLAFFGTGGVGTGVKVLSSAGKGLLTQGALAGSRATTDSAEGLNDRQKNALVGAVAGSLTPLFGNGATAVAKKATSIGVSAGASFGAMIVAAARKNIQSAMFALHRGASAATQTKRVAEAAIRASTGKVPSAVRVKALANTALDEIAFIARNLNPEGASAAAAGAANEAFETAFKNGQFIPGAAVKALAKFSPADLKKLGPMGTRLANFKKFARTLADLDDIETSPEQVKAAVQYIANEKKAQSLVNLAAKIADPEAKKTVVNRIFREAGGAFRAGANVAGGAAVGGTGQLLGQ